MPEKPLKMENADQKIKVESQSQKTRKESEKPAHRRPSANFSKKKDKFGRKRSQSFSGSSGKFCPPYKCRKRPMLPTKFLLGGNICDPLNLNSLQDEEINRTVNAVTPKSSPVPTPPQRRGHIEVIIPPNIHDPLNLIDCSNDMEYEQQLTSPYKKGSKRRKKKKRTSSATTEVSDADISSASEAITPDKSIDSAKIPEIDSSTSEDASPVAKVVKDLKLELSPQKDKKRKSLESKESVKKIRRLDSMDKIVSPVVPQPGAWIKRNVQFNRSGASSGRGHRNSGNKNGVSKMPTFKPKNKAYQYGNYNRYYGYRNPNHEVDPRLKCFANYRHLFFAKDILDIGCNIGHITLTIARDFGAKSIVGLDIDKKLIGIARKNIRHYVNCSDSPRNEQEAQNSSADSRGDKFFPISMPILYGPVDVPGMTTEHKGKGFPHNVTFVQGNYVLADDSLLSTDQTQFDVILCLSVTKWMHLNWGDSGLKQAFKRMYAQLRPGGKLILEPQSWASYKNKKTLTETIYNNYHSIEFFPEKFTQYLLSSEIGFAKSEIMGHPHHYSKGFQRPIQIFTKSDLSPSQSQRSYSATPSYTITSNAMVAKPVYTSLNSPFRYEQEKENEKKRGEQSDSQKEIGKEKLKSGNDDGKINEGMEIDKKVDETNLDEKTLIKNEEKTTNTDVGICIRFHYENKAKCDKSEVRDLEEMKYPVVFEGGNVIKSESVKKDQRTKSMKRMNEDGDSSVGRKKRKNETDVNMREKNETDVEERTFDKIVENKRLEQSDDKDDTATAVETKLEKRTGNEKLKNGSCNSLRMGSGTTNEDNLKNEENISNNTDQKYQNCRDAQKGADVSTNSENVSLANQIDTEGANNVQTNTFTDLKPKNNQIVVQEQTESAVKNLDVKNSRLGEQNNPVEAQTDISNNFSHKSSIDITVSSDENGQNKNLSHLSEEIFDNT